MKYFTPDLMERYGSPDDKVADAADVEWEGALARYEAYLLSIDSALPPHIREFSDLLLHDAIVWSIVRQGEKLIMVLRKDVPPQDIVILTYDLVAEPVISKESLPAELRSTVMAFECDEFELISNGDQPLYAQSILFANGWEMSLRFRDVQVSLAVPIFPLGNNLHLSAVDSTTAKSA